MWKGVAGTTACIAGKSFEVNGIVPDDAMHAIALKASAQEIEPDTNSKRVSLGYCFVAMDTLAAFLRRQDFGKGQGLFAFSGTGRFRYVWYRYDHGSIRNQNEGTGVGGGLNNPRSKNIQQHELKPMQNIITYMET
jgi:hypothetical protein